VKRRLPEIPLLDRRFVYTNAAQTDIRIKINAALAKRDRAQPKPLLRRVS